MKSWQDRVGLYMREDMSLAINKISDLIKAESTDFTEFYTLVHAQVGNCKCLGILRMGCIFDIMQRCYQAEKVANNYEDSLKFKGIWPILILEQLNVRYVYD